MNADGPQFAWLTSSGKKPAAILERREKERDLFFDGKWSNDGNVTVYTRVHKPSYSPDWGSAKRIDITEDL